MPEVIKVENLAKRFVLHTQGGARIEVFEGLNLSVKAGTCLALVGESGSGKSSLLRALYANYKPQAGSIKVRHLGGWVDMASAPFNMILEVRRQTMGYVSQFLRVIPRVPAREVVAEPLLALGRAEGPAAERASELLTRLRIPKRLWDLAPGHLFPVASSSA